MSFHIIYLAWFQTSLCQCLANDCFLCQPVWCCEAIAASILIDRRASDNAEDRISLDQGLREAFQYDYSATFTQHKAIRACIKRFALPIGREHTHFTSIHQSFWLEDCVRTAYQSQRAFATSQTLTSQVQSNQR